MLIGLGICFVRERFLTFGGVSGVGCEDLADSRREPLINKPGSFIGALLNPARARVDRSEFFSYATNTKTGINRGT